MMYVPCMYLVSFIFLLIVGAHRRSFLFLPKVELVVRRTDKPLNLARVLTALRKSLVSFANGMTPNSALCAIMAGRVTAVFHLFTFVWE